MTVEQYIAENKHRLALIARKYNPLTGEGCVACKRKRVDIYDFPNTPVMWLPCKMIEDNTSVRQLIRAGSIANYLENKTGNSSEEAIILFVLLFDQMRFRYDFEYWAFKCWHIEIKLSPITLANGTAGTFQPLVCNGGQQKVLTEVYADLYAHQPIRHIVCKCRQWGCSTLYSAVSSWLQNVLFVGCSSAVVAHVEDAASGIRAMFVNAIEKYPVAYMDISAINTDRVLRLTPYKGSHKTLFLKEKGYRISIGSSQRPDGLRSKNINIAHLSEVAYFEKTKKRTPEALCQSITSGIALTPNTLIVYESTPNGTGNFFHREYVRAKKGESTFRNIFVAWFEIASYSLPVADYHTFIASMTEKEHYIFSLGATLEAIAWYRQKAKEYTDQWRFISEFPSDDIEAFQSSGQLVFHQGDVERLRKGCCRPELLGEVVGDALDGCGAISNLQFVPSPDGRLKVWALPSDEPVANRYVVVVDIGVGLTEKADNSIICVLDRYYMMDEGIPEVVAEWSGHLPKDIIVWKAVQIAKFYNNALLVVEKNSIVPKATDYSQFILETILPIYGNIYTHTPIEQIRKGVVPKYGWHTNHQTKLTVITFFQKVLRENLYYEPCIEAVDEMSTFEKTDKGTYEAIEGNRDDRVITRCIGVFICYNKMPPVLKREESNINNYNHNRNEATFI